MCAVPLLPPASPVLRSPTSTQVRAVELLETANDWPVPSPDPQNSSIELSGG
jgi:hypothetical protein